MNHQPQQAGAHAPTPEGQGQSDRRVILAFMIGIAAVGCLFLLFSLAKPHRTGVVTSVGRVSTYTARSGKGIHASTHRRYASDVKVRVEGTGETATVYYRVGSVDAIPALGDTVEFANSPLVGNTPYPQKWAVRMGLCLIGLDGIAFIIYTLFRRRPTRKKQAHGDPL